MRKWICTPQAKLTHCRCRWRKGFCKQASNRAPAKRRHWRATFASVGPPARKEKTSSRTAVGVMGALADRGAPPPSEARASASAPLDRAGMALYWGWDHSQPLFIRLAERAGPGRRSCATGQRLRIGAVGDCGSTPSRPRQTAHGFISLQHCRGIAAV